MADSAARHLTGRELEGGWQVLNQVELPDDHTGGAFSVGYLCRDSKGQMGYLKALDYQSAFADDDPARALEELAACFNAERDLLEDCRQRKLNRIVRALAAGNVRIEGFSPPVVSYLIFELADADARDMLTRGDPGLHFPMLQLAHNAGVAIAQLHGIGVAHQDVKPSNLLIWKLNEGASGKLGDLGRAHVEGRPSPYEEDLVPGDCSYAPPEQLYRAPEVLPPGVRRYAADMHMLGNLVCFLLTGVSYNALLFRHLDQSQHWSIWNGTFREVLPGLLDAHGLGLKLLSEVLNVGVSQEIVRLIDELCYPDPHRRGDPIARRQGQSPFRLQRYISRLDRLHKEARLVEQSVP